jgi:hypothetical protein
MKNFVKGLVTNRFGIILAALNVCYFISRKLVFCAFSSNCENTSILFNKTVFYWMNVYSHKIMLNINAPAMMAASIFSDDCIKILADFSALTQARFQIVFLIFFITFQWLFIGWAAKTIAQKIQSAQI